MSELATSKPVRNFVLRIGIHEHHARSGAVRIPVALSQTPSFESCHAPPGSETTPTQLAW